MDSLPSGVGLLIIKRNSYYLPSFSLFIFFHFLSLSLSLFFFNFFPLYSPNRLLLIPDMDLSVVTYSTPYGEYYRTVFCPVPANLGCCMKNSKIKAILRSLQALQRLYFVDTVGYIVT